MSMEFETRKWCTIIKMEGYATPSSARGLVQKFQEIVESFKGEGVDFDVFMLLEDKDDSQVIDKEKSRKPSRPSDD